MTLTRCMCALPVAAASIAAAIFASACGGDGDPAPTPTPQLGAVSVLGIWDGEELASFEAMTAPWERNTGGRMEFAGTRDITAILRTRVETGNPPDVALPAEIGLFHQFAREGKLVPLSACDGLDAYVRANYPPSFIELGTVDGVLYGFFMKADTKATIFYDPAFFEERGFSPLTAEANFNDLVQLSSRISDSGTPPWSNGQKANGSTGFPGSDTIQQIILNQHGAEVYDGIVDGTIPYTDARVRDAWQRFDQVTLTRGWVAQGDGAAVADAPFRDSAYPPFEDPPAAAMVHLGGFAAGFIADEFPQAAPGVDFDFFPWPGGAVTGGANIAYAFNADDATCAFLEHIASAEAQQTWVERGGFTSVNREVSLGVYPNAVARAQAEQLLNAPTFRFDMDDAIGGAGQQAIFQGVIEYLRNPASLDEILQDIDAAIRSGVPAATP